MPRRTSKRDSAWPPQSPEVAVIAKVYNREFRLLVSKDLQEGMPMITVTMPKGSNGFSLSSLTADELRAVKGLFELAFGLAEPISAALDANAEKAWDEGDDSFRRLYRAAPLFAVRERVLAEHYSGVSNGPERMAELVRKVRGYTDDLARARGGHSQVPDSSPEGVEP